MTNSSFCVLFDLHNSLVILTLQLSVYPPHEEVQNKQHHSHLPDPSIPSKQINKCEEKG